MFLLANIVLSIGFICAAPQDEPFKYDISRKIYPQESNYMDQVKDELLSRLIQNTLEHSNKDESKLAKNLIESNSIIDEALVEPFTDRYGKQFSNPLDQGTRMKRARKLPRSTNIVPAVEVPEEEEPVHGFVRQLIPSLLPIPKGAYSWESNSSDPKFEDEFKDIYNVSSIDGRGDESNLTTISGVDGNGNGINSTNTADDAKGDDGKKGKDGNKEDDSKNVEDRKKEDDRKKEEDSKKEDDKKNDNEDNNKHDKEIHPTCPGVSPSINDNSITTSPTPSNVDSSTIRVDIRQRKPDEIKPTPSQPTYPRRDGEVTCTDRTLGKNCSEYIISLYDDKIALYLKITSSLKSKVIKPDKPYIQKYPSNPLPYYTRRNVHNTAAYVQKSSKMVTPYYKASPKYFNAEKNYVKPTSVYATTPATRSVSNPTNRVPINSQRRMLPLAYTTPKYMNERRIPVYPTQRTIPEPTNILRKPPQQSIPMRHMTPRSVSVPKQTLPTRTAKPDISELTKQLQHKLKILKDLSAAAVAKTAGKGKLENPAKQIIPDPRLVSKYSNKIPVSNDHKQKVRTSAGKRPVAKKSDLQNMIVPPKQKYRQNSYQFGNKYGNVQSPKPDHLPGVISGLTKREGVTFFNYYPFKSASRTRMRRSAVGSKSKKP